MRLASRSVAILLLVKSYLVNAQAPCAYACIDQSTTSCLSTDLNCLCNDASLTKQATCCLITACPNAADRLSVQQYLVQYCKPYNPKANYDDSQCPSATALLTATAAVLTHIATATNDQPAASYNPFDPSATISPSTSTQKKSKAPVGAIVGGVLGGIAIIGICVFAIVFILLRHRRKSKEATQPAAIPSDTKPPFAPTPLPQGSSPFSTPQPQHQLPAYAQMPPLPGNGGGGAEMPVVYRHEAVGNYEFHQPMAEMPATNLGH